MTGTAVRHRAAVTVLCAVQFMVVLDSTITTVAVDAIRADLHTDERTLQYVVSLYAAAFGGLLLLGGRVADLAGGRRVFVAGAAVFTAASVVCAAATAMPVLLAGRFAQGAGAAFASASAFALLLRLHPEGPGRNRVLGIWAALGAAGAAAGLILGGALVDIAGWHLVFAINVPLGVAAVVVAGRVLPGPSRRSSEAGAARPDVPGAVTATLGTATLVFAVTRGQADGWVTPGTVALLASAAALFALFWAVEAHATDPLVPLRALTRGPVPAAAVAIACLMAVVGSQGVLLVLYLQRILGFGPTATGLAIAPSALTALAATAAAARLAGRLPARVLAVAGLLLVALAQVLLGFLPVDGSYVRDLLPGLLLFGSGLGAAFVGATIAATAGLGPAEEGRASGILNTAQQVGIAVGVAALVSAGAAGSDRPEALVSGYGTGLHLGAIVAAAGAVAAAAPGRTTARRRT
jgi:EmrB/QacA subfamily drug resistance transporter